MIATPKNQNEAKALRDRLETQTRRVTTFLTDNESTWNTDIEAEYRRLESEEDEIASALEEYIEDQDSADNINRRFNLNNAARRKINVPDMLTKTPSAMRSANGCDLPLNYIGDKFRGLPPSSNPDVRDMTSEERLTLLGEELSDIQAGRPREFVALHTTTDGSVVIQDDILSSLLEVIIAKSAFGMAGVPVIPMDADTVKVPRMLTLPASTWLAEGGAITLNGGSLDTVSLTAKKLACATYVTDEFAEASPNVVSAIVDSLATSLAKTLDDGFLNGTGSSNQPKGLTQYDNGTDGVIEKTLAAVDTVTPAELTGIVYDILAADYPGKASDLQVILSVALAEKIDLFTDGDSLPLTNIPKWNDVKKHITTKMASPAASANSMLVFPSEALVIGIRNGVTLKFSDTAVANDGTNDKNAFAEFLRMWRLHTRADLAVVRPGFVNKVIQAAS